MQYVYILQSLKFPDKYYTGSTSDVAARLKQHNAGQPESQSRHTSMYGPWKLVAQIGFEDKAIAHLGEVESLRRKRFAPNQYVGANPYRQSLQLWRDLL